MEKNQKKDGILLIVIPFYKGTFDHLRNITPFSHIVCDFNNHTSENGLTHLEEILNTHNFALDAHWKNENEFERKAKQNIKHRVLHHHVFDTKNISKMIAYVNMELLKIELNRPFHIFLLAKNIPDKVRSVADSK